MPVIGIPVINRPDLLEQCIRSIDVDWPLVVIDNSGTGELGDVAQVLRPDAYVVDPPSNLGVAASWNFVIRTHPAEPWWCLANADTVFAPGGLAKLDAEMTADLFTRKAARWVGMNGDWRCFGLSAEAVERVGLFDENFHPIYCEDADYEWRCDLASVDRYFIEAGATHVGSVAYRSDPVYAEANVRTYPANLAYYEAKWGGRLRGGERFTTPFDRGGSPRDWTLDLSRLRTQSW